MDIFLMMAFVQSVAVLIDYEHFYGEGYAIDFVAPVFYLLLFLAFLLIVGKKWPSKHTYPWFCAYFLLVFGHSQLTFNGGFLPGPAILLIPFDIALLIWTPFFWKDIFRNIGKEWLKYFVLLAPFSSLLYFLWHGIGNKKAHIIKTNTKEKIIFTSVVVVISTVILLLTFLFWNIAQTQTHNEWLSNELDTQFDENDSTPSSLDK